MRGEQATGRPRGAWRALLAVTGLALALLAVPGALRAETRHALVIGNAAYAVAPLSNPRNDAEAIAKSLKSVGFLVTKLVDADQQAMRRAVIEFGRKLRGSDSVGLLYYAGHGVQVAGENFLIPIGADIRDEREIAVQGINLSEILKTMARSESRINIVVLDACRNNPFAASGRSALGGLAQINAPAGTLIAFATAPGEIALDGEGQNSPYSAALALAIPAPGVLLEEMFKRTRRQVLLTTANRQTPWEHSSLTGEFFFAPKAAEPEKSVRPGNLAGIGADQIEEIRAWERIKDTRETAVLREHLAAYPAGVFAELARYRLEQGKPPASDGGAVAGWFGGLFGVARGDPEAETLLEEALKAEARATPEAEAEAFRLYRASAARGLPAAMYQVARAYDHGRGAGRSITEAAVWYGRAADLGHAPSMASLGIMHEFGEGVPVDLAAALRLYRLAAEAGEAHGMTSLGYLYQQGKGVAKDGVEARAWYAKAAERGNPRAMFNLALMQIRGEGGERDFGEAVGQLKAAIEKGHVGALRELAFLFDEGRGVARDPKAAAEYLLAAFKAGHQDARMDLLVRPEAWSLATRKEVQRRLAASGRDVGRATGYFDTRTRRAIEAYGKG